MTLADIPEVLQAERNTLSAWSSNQYESQISSGCGWQFTAKDSKTGKMLGFICGRSAADEAEILKLTVHENSRNQGIGNALLNHAMQHLQRSKIKKCYLELRESNKPALNLYLKNCFNRIGSRKNYYINPMEHAIIMERIFL